MAIDIYSSFFLQMLLFVLLAAVLVISVVSLFIKPAKRTIRASLVETDSGHIIDISRSETSIGRAKACDISISDISVSRFHAVLSKRSSGWMIFDTHSTAGIKINGKKIEKKSALSDGDSILLGNTEYVFYSTAVTTRQQIVRKAKNETKERPVYRKQKPDSDRNIEYKKKQTTSKNSDTDIRYEKKTKSDRRK